MATSTKPESTAVATTEKPSPVAALLLAHRSRIEDLLPEGVAFSRLIAQVRVEVTKNPKILECTQLSVVESICRVQQWGLQIGVSAYLVPYGKTCTPVADYKGLASLMVESRAVRAVQARTVFANEAFEYEYGLEERLVHRPIHDPTKRGAILGAYCILRLPGGRDVFEFMSIEDIEVIRKGSKQWGPDKVAMCPPWYAKKTVIRQVSKLVPKNPRFERVLSVIDEELADGVDRDEDRPTPAPTGAATSAAPSEDADWTLDDDEPAVVEGASNAEPTTVAGEPECPTCSGQMWDNRPKKASGQYKPNAPDFTSRDRECGGKLWPGQWPPKTKATQDELAL